nr:respiratory nitrate reductase subunit gamma [Pseudodesulfovibrio sp.]
MYDFLTGPMLWVTFLVSFGGLIVRAVMYVRGLSWQLDRVAYRPNMSYGLRGGFRSILAFIIPFKARLWRVRPGFTIIFFAFHIGLLVTPIFLEAHNVMLQDAFGFSLPALPTFVADTLVWICLVGGLFMVLRRIAFPEVRIITTFYDYLLLVITVMPFVTGLIARYEMGDYNFWLMAHIISAEIWLLCLPFTKLSHAILFFMSRMQLGMDYGIKRGGMKGSDMSW